MKGSTYYRGERTPRPSSKSRDDPRSRSSSENRRPTCYASQNNTEPNQGTSMNTKDNEKHKQEHAGVRDLYPGNNLSVTSLTIGSINVCGLKRRAEYPEFSDILSKYDLLCVTETKLGQTDVVSVPGYTFSPSTANRNILESRVALAFFANRIQHLKYIS